MEEECKLILINKLFPYLEGEGVIEISLDIFFIILAQLNLVVEFRSNQRIKNQQYPLIEP